MPPKKTLSVKEVIDAAWSAVREEGLEKLSARTLAARLGVSTMPIYSTGITMADIEVEVIKRAWELLEEYQSVERTGDKVIDMGVGFLIFAKNEKHLFRCFQSERHSKLNIEFAERNFMASYEMLKDHEVLKKLPTDVMMTVIIQSWIFANGITHLLDSPIAKTISMLDSDESIIKFISEATEIYWRGFESYARDKESGKTNGSTT